MDNFDFKEWIIAVTTLLVSLALVALTRRILTKIHKNRGWTIIGELTPLISNLLTILVFKLFIDLAPLRGRIEVWLDSAVYTISIFILMRLIQQTAIFGIQWSVQRSDRSKALQQGFVPLLTNFITLFVFFTGVIMMLKHFNYDVMSLVTALGVSSLAVGLAAKDTLSNMISGFILIIDKNLGPGDRINLAGSIGDVREIGLRSTRIELSDGNSLIVPNAELVNTKILNLSMVDRAMASSVNIRVPLEYPFSKIKDICLSAVGEIEKIPKNKKAAVQLQSLSDGHQLIAIGFWVNEHADVGAVASELNERLLEKLKTNGIRLLSHINLKSID